MSMPNVTGFEEHPDNPEWIRLNFDDGSQSGYAQDPDGRFRQQASEVAQKLNPSQSLAPTLASNPLAMPSASAAPSAPAVAPLAQNPLAMPAPTAPAVKGAPSSIARPGLDPSLVAPEPITQVVLPRDLPPAAREQARIDEARHQYALGQEVEAQNAKAAKERQAKEDAEQMRGAQPYQLMQTPGTGPQVSRSSTTQSSGYAPEDRKKIDAANAAAVEAEHEANVDALITRRLQVDAEWQRLSEQEKQKLAEEAARKEQEADLKAKVDAQTRKMEELTSRPIDPSRAFAGDAGWYAFMAGFGDSLQNFGAALAGRGPVANPGATIDRMIDRSVAMQTQEIEQQFKQGKITADQLQAEREYVRAQLATAGKQLADTQLSRARNEDEAKALQAMGSKLEADRKAAIAKNAAATARQQQVSTTTQVQPGAPGGVSLFMGEKPDWDAVKALSEKNAGADQVERGVSRLEKAAGWTWDEKANNGLGGYIGADGKPVTADSADPSGISIFGSRFSTGEGARELNGALEDMAAGGAKVKDPIGAVSDKSVAAEKDAMAANTDEGILRAAERTRRNLRGMRASIDSGFSPGVVNAARYRKSAENLYRNNQPGLPRSHAASPEELRR